MVGHQLFRDQFVILACDDKAFLAGFLYYSNGPSFSDFFLKLGFLGIRQRDATEWNLLSA